MIKDLLSNNLRWANAIKEKDPTYFPKLAEGQNPEYLWIGCSDSRVPANAVVGTHPGEIFVHRNIANQVVHTDLNLLSVLQYAVDALKVEHIIVCGHYSCGGVEAALEGKHLGLIDNWLQSIKDIHHRYEDRFEGLSSQEKSDLLCELNVIEQVNNVSETSIVQQAWERGQKVCVHGWIYSIADGLIKDLKVSKGDNNN